MTTATANNVAKAEKELSMSPSAVRSRARRATQAALKEVANEAPTVGKIEVNKTSKATKATTEKAAPKTRKQATVAVVKVSAAQKRTIGQFMASIAAGFLPIASFVMAHHESKENPLLWGLVIAALLFSAPTLADWAYKWAGNKYKAWGFTVLLEGVMVASHTEWLSFAGLIILVLINATNAYGLAARKVVSE